MKSKVFILGNYQNGLRFDETWKFVASQIQSWGYDVEYIGGASAMDYDQYDLRHISEITKGLSNILFRKKIEDGDIFIFPNARDPLTIVLRDYFHILRINVILIGFWIDRTYYTKISKRNRIKKYTRDITWPYKYERTIFDCLDYNLITTLDTYSMTCNNKALINKMTYCPLPFSMTEGVAKTLAPEIFKDDAIIMNVLPENVTDNKTFGMLKLKYPDITFINFYNKIVSYSEYYRLLSRAKVQFSTEIHDINPYSLYEGMVLGCMPLVPTTQIYIEMFEKEEWMYDLTIFKPPYYNFLRRKDELYSKLEFLFENYDTLKEQLKKDTKRIHDKYFDSTYFKKILENI